MPARKSSTLETVPLSRPAMPTGITFRIAATGQRDCSRLDLVTKMISPSIRTSTYGRLDRDIPTRTDDPTELTHPHRAGRARRALRHRAGAVPRIRRFTWSGPELPGFRGRAAWPFADVCRSGRSAAARPA